MNSTERRALTLYPETCHQSCPFYHASIAAVEIFVRIMTELTSLKIAVLEYMVKKMTEVYQIPLSEPENYYWFE